MSEAMPRALVVEDDRSWQGILRELLADCGLAVDVATGYDEAVAALRAAPHRLAVVDLSLAPGDHRNRDGLRVLDAVRRLDPGCTALLLSGYATVELAVSALRDYGALTCLRKEAFSRVGFRETVRRALAAPPRAVPDEETLAGDGDGAAEPARVPPGSRALLVEDDAGWRSILAELLAEAGYEVRGCASYGEARGCLRRERYGVAVVDLSLASSVAPGDNLDGYRLLAATRGAGIPTVVVSGVAGPEEIERAYEREAIFASLEKQAFDRRAFLRTVVEARGTRPVPAGLDRLTEREREVLELLAQGLTNKEMAERLVITGNTVKRHLKAIFEKLEVHTRSAAAAKAVGGQVPAARPVDGPAEV